MMDYTVFTLSGTPVTVGSLLVAVAILAGAYVLSRLLQRGIKRAFRARGVSDEGTIGVTTRLVHYLMGIAAVGTALQTVGVKLTTLFAAGAVMALAVGFALQTVLQSFVAGVIMLVERTIKPGDVLEVNGEILKVKRLGIRSTVARSREHEDLLIPNAKLVQSTVKNLTYRGKKYRIRVPVGVAYRSDMARVRQVLERAGRDFEPRLADPAPLVLLRSFGSSSVNWELSVWTNDPWREQQLHSALNEAVWNALREAGITIAFPQVDVHLDEPVLRALEGHARAA